MNLGLAYHSDVGSFDKELFAAISKVDSGNVVWQKDVVGWSVLVTKSSRTYTAGQGKYKETLWKLNVRNLHGPRCLARLDVYRAQNSRDAGKVKFFFRQESLLIGAVERQLFVAEREILEGKSIFFLVAVLLLEDGVFKIDK